MYPNLPPTYDSYNNQNGVPPINSGYNYNANQGVPPPAYNMYNQPASYGMYGGGMPPIQPMSYEQMMGYRQQLMAQRQQYQQKMLDQNYPVKYVIAHSIIVGSLSIVAIALQIVMIVNQSLNYNIGAGIWVGSYLLIAISLALLLSQYLWREFLNVY
jgi:hypothetical protein